jgi:WD40 repeat protein
VDELPDESLNKKKKSDMSSTVKTPIITLAGHTENISSCKWIDDTTVVTASWDHSIKVWDMFAGHEVHTMKSLSKIFLSIDYSPVNKLIAAGLNDSVIRVYDHRSNEGNLVKISLTSHTGWCPSVCWSRTNENLLVSGSYDTLAKLWDIRK